MNPNEMNSDAIPVEVAYALPEKQKIITLNVRPGTTALQAAEVSGIAFEFPEIDFESVKMGVFGKLFGTKGLEPADQYVLQPMDRVEIYRPLLVDPKEVRRKRAEKKKKLEQEDE